MELDSFKRFIYLKEIAKNKFTRFREKEGIAQEEIDRAHADFEKLQAARKIPQTFNIQAKEFEGQPLTFKLLRDLLDVKIKELEKEEQEKLQSKEKKKTVKDNYTLIEENARYKVIEPLSNPCVWQWAPKSTTGDSVWCIGWSKQQNYFNEYISEKGARYFLVIDKEADPNLSRYAFVPMSKSQSESQYRDFTNQYNIKASIRNKILNELPKTKELIKKQLGDKWLTLDYDVVETLKERDKPERLVVKISKDTDDNNPKPSSPYMVGLLDENGKTLLPCKYNYIQEDNGMLIVNEGDLENDNNRMSALADWVTGKIITPFKYTNIDVQRGKYVKVIIGGGDTPEKTGICDKQGHELIPCIYTRINIGEGVFYVWDKDLSKGILNEKGESIIPVGKYTDIDDFYTVGEMSIANATLKDEEGNSVITVIDNHGKELFPAKYASIFSFDPDRDNLAIAADFKGRYTVINLQGKEIVPRIYADIDFEDDHLRCILPRDANGNVRVGIYGFDGKEIIAPKYSALMYDELLKVYRSAIPKSNVEDDHLWGIIDITGKEIVPCKYDQIERFGRSLPKTLARVLLNGKYGAVNVTGIEVIPCRFDVMEAIDNEYIDLGIENEKGEMKRALADVHGKIFTEPIYSSINSFDDDLGLARVSRLVVSRTNEKELYGFINKEGKEVIPCQFERLSDFFNGFSKITQKGKTGLIDSTGKIIVKPKYSDIIRISPYPKGLIKVMSPEGLKGYVNKQGVEVIPCKYSHLETFDENSTYTAEWAKMKTPEGRYGQVNIQGKEKWDK